MEQLPKQEYGAPAGGAKGCPEEMQCPPQQMHRRGGRPHGHGPEERRGGARLTVYFLLCILCNFLLAVFMLYALGLSVQLATDAATAGQQASLAETVYRIALLLSPLLITVLLNRLLYRAMRGRRHRFARWVAPVACLVVIAVQAATVWLLFFAFGTGAAPGFAIDTVTSLMP